jgi:hypothetical protein
MKADSEDPEGIHNNSMELTTLLLNLALGFVWIYLTPQTPCYHILWFWSYNMLALAWLLQGKIASVWTCLATQKTRQQCSPLSHNDQPCHNAGPAPCISDIAWLD